MMKKKNKNRKRKALAAVGAVVAAGLTPGIISASPVQGSNAGVTAAQVVAINGMTYGFDELYAMQQSGSKAMPGVSPQHAMRYGTPHPSAYGVTRPSDPYYSSPSSSSAADSIRVTALEYLMDYCAWLIDADARGIIITPDSDLTNELGLNEDDLKDLKAEIKEYFGVEVSHHRFRLIGQLNTLRLVSEYITRLKTIWYKQQ